MFLKKEDQPAEIRSRVQQGNGDLQYRLFLPAEEAAGSGRLFAHITLRQGESIGYHRHEGEFEIYYIVKGKAFAVENDLSYEMLPGDMMQCKSGSGHSLENREPEDLELLALILYTQE